MQTLFVFMVFCFVSHQFIRIPTTGEGDQKEVAGDRKDHGDASGDDDKAAAARKDDHSNGEDTGVSPSDGEGADICDIFYYTCGNAGQVKWRNHH